MTVHPWHDIEVGEDAPEIINCIIEIPKNSQLKYELHKETGLLKLDRYLYSAVHYPADYGFIPQTLWDDGDPLDILVLTGHPTYPMTLCEVRVIGTVVMIDENEADNKILAVHCADPRFQEFESIDDIPTHSLRELRHFLSTYKDLQGKTVDVYEILGPKRAFQDIKKAMTLYKKRFQEEDSVSL